MSTQQNALPGFNVEARNLLDQSHEAERRLFTAMLGDLSWGDQFAALIGEGWPWRKAAYIAWAALPATYRQPATLADFASIIGLKTTTAIRTWRTKNAAIDAAVAKLAMGALLESAPDVVAALTTSASDPSYKHAPDRKVYLEIAGIYTPKSKHELSLDDNSTMENMSDQELARLAGLSDDVEAGGL